MKTLASLMIASALVFSYAQSGHAQVSAPAAPAAPAASKAPAMPKAMSADDMAKKAKAKECSAKADAQGLDCDRKPHTGCMKERWEFRKKCKKGEM